jgi:hypothetical protein
MNGKKARKLRKMINCDLSSYSEDKAHGVVDVGTKRIAQIQPDGNHTVRETPQLQARSTEVRHLNRTLKRIYNGSKEDTQVRDDLRDDLNNSASISMSDMDELAELTAETKKEQK